MNKALAVFVVSIFASVSNAASFDCDKASTFIEKAICSDQYLSELDNALGRAYKDALSNTGDVASLRSAQRDWIAHVRNQCQNVTCLTRAYNGRLSELSGGNRVGTQSTVAGRYEYAQKGYTGDMDVTEVSGVLSASISSILDYNGHTCEFTVVENKEVRRMNGSDTVVSFVARDKSDDYHFLIAFGKNGADIKGGDLSGGCGIGGDIKGYWMRVK